MVLLRAQRRFRNHHRQGVEAVTNGRDNSLDDVGQAAEALPALALKNFEKERETHMKSSTKDQLQGKVHEVKGRVKEKIGLATDDPALQAEGQDEKVAGKIQKKIGQVKKVFDK
jgi:uncharacterized protein YjbJ (UPF0337 family)